MTNPLRQWKETSLKLANRQACMTKNKSLAKSLVIVALLLTLANIGCGANDDLGYASPEDAFEAADAALAEEDYRKYAKCLTPEVQTLKIAGIVQSYLGAKGKIDVASTITGDHGDLEELKKMFQAMNEALERHGVDLAQLPPAPQVAAGMPKGDPRIRQAVQDVEDKPALFGDLMAAMRHLSMFDPAFMRRTDGTLGTVTIDGDSASARFTPGPNNSRGPNPRMLYFRKTNQGGWQIDREEKAT